MIWVIVANVATYVVSAFIGCGLALFVANVIIDKSDSAASDAAYFAGFDAGMQAKQKELDATKDGEPDSGSL